MTTENTDSSFLSALMLCLALSVAAGCASKPAKPAPVPVHAVVSEEANPDDSGRPSPVVVRVYQLRDEGEFNAAEFFALYEREKEALAQSLVAREEYVLEPGETRELEIALDAQTRYLGALAAYRDIRAARWRATVPAPQRKLTDLLGKDAVTLHVGKDSLSLTVRD